MGFSEGAKLPKSGNVDCVREAMAGPMRNSWAVAQKVAVGHTLGKSAEAESCSLGFKRLCEGAAAD